LFGIYGFNMTIQNYSEGPLKLWYWPLIIGGVVGSFWPLNWIANIVGAVLIVAVVVLSSRNKSA
ncbi:MAG: hypothetical protein HWE12_12100, partial [Oceanospirillaceae bacterium]|nr:hypothetical protein [Oceanospirillaceae bacterium]